MRPIPRAMLTDTATLAQAPGGAYGEQTPQPLAVLTRVFVEEDCAATVAGTDTQAKRNATLLYDARHSRPAAVVFEPGQQVTCRGRVYRVESVAQYRTGERLHHVEVGLIG